MDFSIIIPHKNIPELLKRCLDSIPTMDNLEVIIVDDNSDNKKLNSVFRELDDKSNVKIIYDKNEGGSGAGHARNIGLKNSIGRWVLFADADDFFNIGFINALNKYKYSNADIIFYSCTSVDSDTLEKSDRDDEIVANIVENYNKNDPKSEDQIRYNFLVPWSKMYSSKFLKEEGLRFEEIIASNDVMFSTYAGHLANEIIIDDSKIYCVTSRKGSLTTQTGINILDARMEVVTRYNEFVFSINKNHLRASWANYLYKYRRFSNLLFLEKLFTFFKGTKLKGYFFYNVLGFIIKYPVRKLK